MRLALVRDERILLPVAAQVNALAELFHQREVLYPVRVDRAQEHPALDGARELLAELLLARLVGFVDELRHALAELLLVLDALEALRRDRIGFAQHRAQGRGELLAVPVLWVR